MNVLWSQEHSTVGKALTNIAKGSRLSEKLVLETLNICMGPWDVNDKLGTEIAIGMLRGSQAKGRKWRECSILFHPKVTLVLLKSLQSYNHGD